MEEKISDFGNITAEMDTVIKENVKYKYSWYKTSV